MAASEGFRHKKTDPREAGQCSIVLTTDVTLLKKPLNGFCSGSYFLFLVAFLAVDFLAVDFLAVDFLAAFFAAGIDRAPLAKRFRC